MKRFAHPFHRLQWKLTLSYTLITIVTSLLIELLTFIVLLTYILANQATLLANSVRIQATQAVPYFVHGTPDREELAKWLQIVNRVLPTGVLDTRQQGFLVVVDRQGLVLASRGRSAPPVKTPLQNVLSAKVSSDLAAALRGDNGTNFGEQESNGMLVLLAPIQEGGGPILGALVAKLPAINSTNLFLSYGNLLNLVGINLVLLTLLAGGAGTLFGSLTARTFTRRFKKLSQVADNWSHGDFSAFVHDPARDELGQLSRRLNNMAQALQTLLDTRQQLATLEERNRLARDLHDSIKQQIFSLAMQVGALKVLLRRDVDAAERRLNEIERMVGMAQEELTALIHELRPVALENQDLATALQDLVQHWEHQTWISTQVKIEEETDTLPAEVEEALLRIAQEALSNVARHSNATVVQLQLRREQENILLLISDNGQGFNVAKAEGRGIGLLSMRERIQALGGTLYIESTLNKGTALRVRCSATRAIKKGTVR